MIKNLSALSFSIFFTAVIFLNSHGQEISYDLKNCITYALQNHKQIRNKKLTESIEKERLNELLTLGLTQISGSINYKYNFEIPIAVIGNQVIRMGTRHQFTTSLEATQMVYDDAYRGNVLLAELQQELSQYNTRGSEIDVVASVTKAYYGILITQKQLELLDTNIERLRKSLRDTQLQYDNGLAQKVDVSRVQVMLNNALTEKKNILRIVKTQEQLLKFQMGMPLKSFLKISDVFKEETFKEALLSAPNDDFYKDRVEYILAEKQKKIVSLQTKNIYRAYLPSVSLFGSYKLALEGENFDRLFSMGYYPNYLIGIKINVPIFSGLKKTHQLEQAKIQEEIAQNTIDYLENSMRYELNQTQQAFQNALDNLNTQKDNRKLAQTNYENLKYQYRNGIRPSLEVLSAQTSLKDAETEYIKALYEILINKVNLEKALGKIKIR